MTTQRRKVLVVSDYFLPGYKAGGPVRSIAAWVDKLGDDLVIDVVCLDRDLGAKNAYPGVPTRTWLQKDKCRVLYLNRRRLDLLRAFHLINKIRPDIVYINNVFSIRFTVYFIVAARHCSHKPEIILAPRGQLCPGALTLNRFKRLKKRLFLAACRRVDLWRDVLWQASSQAEAHDIRNTLRGDCRIKVAPDMRLSTGAPRLGTKKEPGNLRAIYLSRISPKKNLLFALELLMQVDGIVNFTVAGPIGDPGYWSRCQQLIKMLPKNVSVHVEGPVEYEDVASLLAQHELLLLPTLSENYGHVIVESFEVGTPVLISDQTPWRNLQRFPAGWDLPLEERSSFAKALQDCIDMGAVDFYQLSSGAIDAGRVLAAEDSATQSNRDLFGLPSS